VTIDVMILNDLGLLILQGQRGRQALLFVWRLTEAVGDLYFADLDNWEVSEADAQTFLETF